MTRRRDKPGGRARLARTFAIPAGLFGLSLGGLILALLVRGWPDIPATLAAGSGLAAFAWAVLARR